MNPTLAQLSLTEILPLLFFHLTSTEGQMTGFSGQCTSCKSLDAFHCLPHFSHSRLPGVIGKDFRNNSGLSEWSLQLEIQRRNLWILQSWEKPQRKALWGRREVEIGQAIGQGLREGEVSVPGEGGDCSVERTETCKAAKNLSEKRLIVMNCQEAETQSLPDLSV